MGSAWGFPWHGDSPPLESGIQEIALLKNREDLMTWSHTHFHCFLFNRNETATESSLHWKAVELGSIFWRKKCEEFMDTLYPHHRQDAVAMVQARSNEAGESTVAGGTHQRHCYQDVPSQLFIWWGRGWHLCVKIRVNWVRLWAPPRPLNQHPYRVHRIQSCEPWFCLQINLPVIFTHRF